jgi:hypothetical protein
MRWRYSIHHFASLRELALARGDLAQTREHAAERLERHPGAGAEICR